MKYTINIAFLVKKIQDKKSSYCQNVFFNLKNEMYKKYQKASDFIHKISFPEGGVDMKQPLTYIILLAYKKSNKKYV